MAPPVQPRSVYMTCVREFPFPTSVKAVGWCLGTYMGLDGVAWPSMATLAAGTGLSERSVRRALRVLESAGLVVTERRIGGPNRYRTPVIAVAGVGDIAVSPPTGHGWPHPRTPAAKTPDTAVADEQGMNYSGTTPARTTANMTDDEFRAWADRGRDVP